MTVFSRMPCWYYDKKDLKRSPSILDGISTEKESRYRREGARFIINTGTKMGLRYDTMATGVVYFHRFYMFHSFQTFPRYITACCCLFLAGKVEETPKKCKDIIKVAKSFLTDAQFAQFGDDPKEEVMTLERILLQTIKFDLQVDHPYGHLLRYAKCLKGDKSKLEKMVQMAWTFINDSLCTTLCLQWEPEVIAIALMYLAGKLSKFEVMDWVGRIPKHGYWWDIYVQGMTIELLEDICHQVLDLYSTPVPDTPHDSPPATPPTKTTIRKVNPASPGNLPSSPVAVKSKEAMVGQPIPRLEPGELKRKTAKLNSKKEGPEAKIPAVKASSSAQSSAAVAPAVNSPKRSTEETEATKVLTPEPSDIKKSVAGRFIPTIETAAYHTGVSGRPPKTVASVSKIEVIKDILAKTNVDTTPVQAEKTVSSQLHKLSFVTETADAFYAENYPSTVSHIPFPQNASYMNPHRLLRHDSVLLQAPPIRPPPPTQYEDIYRPPPVPSLQPVQPPPLPPPPQAQYPPPPVPNIRPMNQYAPAHIAPPPPPPQPQTVMPNVSLPPPNLPQMPLPPPIPSNARNEHMHGPVPTMSGPPPPLPHGIVPSQPVNPHMPLPPPPSHYMPRPEPDSYGHDLRNEDHLQNQRMPMPVHGPPPPPRYMREGPPPSMSHPREGPPPSMSHPREGPPPSLSHPREGPPPSLSHLREGPPSSLPHPDFCHYDRERPAPHYRPKPEYEREQHHHRDHYREYDDYGPSRGPPNPYEYDNMMRRHYDMEQQQQLPHHQQQPPHHQQQPPHHHVQRNLERGHPPMMINNQRPRMESPTGIPPVRITGRY